MLQPRALRGSQIDATEAGLKREPEACPIGSKTRIMSLVRLCAIANRDRTC